MIKREVWIVQPYVPKYRVAFFEGLMNELDHEMRVRVVSGAPSDDQRLRKDSAHPDWLVEVDPHVIHLGKRTATLTSTRSCWAGSDAVIVPHMGSSRDTLSALSRRATRRVGVWGHIAPYTSKPNPIDAAIERWQLKRADEVFAYTPGGAEFASRAGVPDSRITTVMNAIDTSTFEREVDEIDSNSLDTFRAKNAIAAPKWFGYVGGLDSSKKIDLLSRVLDELHRLNSKVHLVIGGEGAQRRMLEAASTRGQVTLVGYSHGRDKAALLRGSVGILNLGRVGLIAVDALIAGRPIITSIDAMHGPEHEYLVEGVSVYTLKGTAADIALNVDRLFLRFRDTPPQNWDHPTLNDMVSNYADGIRRLVHGTQ